ncbi:hypothetical protein B296_00029230 [Ensete ventricosum]|uniref:Uncharacterized protein n=1 Tax=Ensete ventricosum TaxID=4639 RepID=A0A426YPN2_ENSVE|nr:hypothetical protein B296_00029230 [Ensete ventricosum]
MGKQSMTTSSPCLRSSWDELAVAEKMALVPANGPFQLTRPPHLAHHRHPSRRCYCEVGRPDRGWGCRSRHRLGKVSRTAASQESLSSPDSLNV